MNWAMNIFLSSDLAEEANSLGLFCITNDDFAGCIIKTVFLLLQKIFISAGIFRKTVTARYLLLWYAHTITTPVDA
jgi:hypothetical protein